MNARIPFLLFAIFAFSGCVLAADASQYRNWIEQMKTAERGPFSRVLWYCRDGQILPPKAYACAKHGGGVQHGALSERTRILREQGYRIANLLAGIDPAKALASEHFRDHYHQLLIEKFLIATDNGWILRKARFYRGAIQEEDERRGARALLTAMAADDEWIQRRYPALRLGVSLLPHGKDSASVREVRQMAASLADQDPEFHELRVKIHGSPDAGDANRVRNYARKREDPGEYLQLAEAIDRVYRAKPLPELLEAHARIFSGAPWLQTLLRDAAKAHAANPSPENRHAVTARLLADLRRTLPKIRSASARLRVLDLGLAVEADHFSASTQLRKTLDRANRRSRLQWLRNAALAAYGTGLLNQRLQRQVALSIDTLAADRVPLQTYREELRYLARAPGWGTQGLRFHFYESMQKLAEIEPLALQFIQDQLRGSPLLFLSQTLDTLTRDGNRLAGVRHKLFGKELGVGFHALNPGLARGRLHTRIDREDLESIAEDGIYVLPETISELPPVAGIITAGEGNPLSHIQLLARNLGIPNVTVDTSLLDVLHRYDGKMVVLAVSPSGLVELHEDDHHWRELFVRDDRKPNVRIRPDLEKLDLDVRGFIDLQRLRADDSGRIVGPKAAKLGELRHHYPDKVARGLAIPFGVFREVVLDQPYGNSDRTVFDWMVSQYRRIETLPLGSAERKQATESFRTEVYDLILHTDPGEAFQSGLKTAFLDTFGSTDLGVFVRSDTNVEDLPGFTGAGLNLTLPNVTGFAAVLAAINKVWASPFTARAFAWRQSLMQNPEHVYPAILLLRSVANDKSGVMVTQDIDTGDRQVLSVAVNEGVGGAVDGQSAESLRIDMRNGKVRVLATATAPWRRQPARDGGIRKLPASGADTLLQPGEIQQLITLARELPDKFPAITDDSGQPAPADIEFGFLDGELQLFQLRPFLDNRKTRGNRYLQAMDQSLQNRLQQRVDMRQIPARP